MAGEWNIEAILELLLTCGRICLDGQARAPWALKPDGSLVTAVDRAVESLLADRFDRPAAGHFMIGEETVGNRDEAYVQAALRGTAWIVDPVDGTAPFAHGLSYWGTAIGLAQAGHIVHGALILPVQGEVFVTVDREVWWARGVDVHGPALRVRLERLVPQVLPLTAGGMVALGQRFVKTRTLMWPNPVVATGCTINALAYLMLGRLMGCIGHMKLWDVAGVLPMLERTGIEAWLADGTPMTTCLNGGAFVLAAGSPDRWSQRDHAAFGGPDVVRALVSDVLGGRPPESPVKRAVSGPETGRAASP